MASRPLRRDRRRRDRLRVPVPGLRQRRHDDGHRTDHRHPAPVRLGRRLVDDLEPGRRRRAARDPRPRRAAARMKQSAAALAAHAGRPGGEAQLGRAPASIALGGARELVPLLAKELRAGGDAAAVSETYRPDAAAFVWIGRPDEHALRTASLARIPIVGVTEGERLPYVLDTNLVRIAPAAGCRSTRSRQRSPACSGQPGPGLAARLPVLRPARRRRADPRRPRDRNALVGVAAWIPGVDLPDPDAQPAPARLRDRDRRRTGTRRRALCRSCSGSPARRYGWRRVARTLDGLPVPAVVVRQRSRVRRDARGRRGASAAVSPEPGPSDRGPRLFPTGRRDPRWA